MVKLPVRTTVPAPTEPPAPPVPTTNEPIVNVAPVTILRVPEPVPEAAPKVKVVATVKAGEPDAANVSAPVMLPVAPRIKVPQAALVTSTVTVALFPIVTSSPATGTTPPIHVVVELQFPLAEAVMAVPFESSEKVINNNSNPAPARFLSCVLNCFFMIKPF